METTECRLSCVFRRGDRFADGMVHLIEVRYNGNITFWNGVVDVTDELFAFFTDDESNHPFGMELEDGRKGAMNVTYFRVTDGHNLVAVVGSPSDD